MSKQTIYIEVEGGAVTDVKVRGAKVAEVDCVITDHDCQEVGENAVSYIEVTHLEGKL